MSFPDDTEKQPVSPTPGLPEDPLPPDGVPAAPRPPENGAVSKKDGAEGEPMSLLGHLGELRRRLTRVVIIIVLGFIACYGISEALYDFLSEPLIAAMPSGSTLIYTSPAGAFFVYLKVSLLASLFLTSPFSFYQIWAFIGPGLYKEEKQVLVPLSLLSAFFFLIGAAFCYTMVFPLAFRFFMGMATETIVPMISVEEYLSFALKLLIAFGVVFEMPLFAFFLGRLGILTPDFMRRQRKYAVLLIFIVAAILTPPDVFSQVLMAMPMFLLYEVSIYVAGWSRGLAKEERKREAEKAAEPQEKAAEPQGGPHGDAQDRS
jgi:sec-independent protein translocase protein TatC